MKTSFINQVSAALAIMIVGGLINISHAQISTDLQGILSDAQSANIEMQEITLSANTICSELLSAHQSIDALIKRIEAVNTGITSTFSIDADSLQALDDLSSVAVSMAANINALSMDLTLLNTTTDMPAISAGISAMLRLSSDIGVMADRILEMSNKILVMADNIGLMADRIIITQQIQSDNLALTQASMLATQQNVLALVSVYDSSIYRVEMDAQVIAGNLLAIEISSSALSTFNMAKTWGELASDVDNLKMQVETSYQAIQTASEANTFYIDADSYSEIVDMSIMASSIGIAMQGLALATEGLSVFTRDSTLDASMESILAMSADIGVMADRILEMADLILAMADNIGLTADQIIATQQLQSTHYAATLGSLEATQQIAISIIAVNGL